jgi:hypothetical protein
MLWQVSNRIIIRLLEYVLAHFAASSHKPGLLSISRTVPTIPVRYAVRIVQPWQKAGPPLIGWPLRRWRVTATATATATAAAAASVTLMLLRCPALLLL